MTIKLIVALDFNDQQQTEQLVDQLNPKDCALKIGSELFTLYGPSLVRKLINKGFKIFLDLKFYDIPNTVAQACKACAELGVWMLNVHASGGFKMMQAAQKALEEYGSRKPLLIAVTVLTSFNEEEWTKTSNCKGSLIQQALNLSVLAQDAGLEGVVSSAHEVKKIKALCGPNFLTITPGIRLANSFKQDQVRTMTPEEALKAGADYLVIGRPITQALNPTLVLSEILAGVTGAD